MNITVPKTLLNRPRIDLMLEALSFYAYIFLGGIPFYLLAKLRPNWTHMLSSKEVPWDYIGLLAALFFSLINQKYIASPIFYKLSGFSSLRYYQENILEMPRYILVPLFIVLLDFFSYWFHRIAHESFLWPTHAWHHSAKSIYFVSGFRSSFIHVVWLNIPHIITFTLLPINRFTSIYAAYKVFEIANASYLHSNIKVPLQKYLELIFVTPRVHLIHHLSDPQYTNSNYGLIVTIWDRLFGTYTHPKEIDQTTTFGLDYEQENWKMLLGLPRGVNKKSSETI